MKILAFESSCDETAVAVVDNGTQILSNEVLSQTADHAPYGGVVPEIASRRHMEVVAPLTTTALDKAGLGIEDIDAVAVTAAPGLIGALLVGVNFAKTLAYKHNKPLVPIHHLRGHIAAGYLADPSLRPPMLTLVVSGGHTQIIEVEDYTVFKVLGSTRDDAAGEAFDKIARVLGLGYPGGPAIALAAERRRDGPAVKPPHWKPRVAGLDMSFSGLKTAFINAIHAARQRGCAEDAAAVAAAFQDAAAEILVEKMRLAFDATRHTRWLLCGGVAANAHLRACLLEAANDCGCKLTVPPPFLCADNAAMIAAAAFHALHNGQTADLSLNARASMEIEEEFIVNPPPFRNGAIRTF